MLVENPMPESECHGQFSDFLEWLMINVQKSFESLDNCVNNTIGLIGKLDDNLVRLNDNLKLLNISVPFKKHLPGEDIYLASSGGVDAGYIYSQSIDREYNSQSETKRENQLIDGVRSVSKLTEGVLSFSDKIGGLSPDLKKLKNAVSVLNKSWGFVSAAEELSAVLSGSGNVTAGIIAAADFLSSALGIAGIAAEFGPPGWIVAAGAVTVAEIMSLIAKEQNKQKTIEAVEKRHKVAEATFEMLEPDAGVYVGNINKVAEQKWQDKQKQHAWHVPFIPVKENIDKFGKNAYDLNFPVQRAITDNLTPNIITPKYREHKGVISQDNKEPGFIEPSFMQKTFGLKYNLISEGLNKGKDGFELALGQFIQLARGLDKKYNFHLTEMVLATGKDAAYSLVNTGNGGRIMPDNLKQNRRDPYVPGRSNGVSNGSNGRVININLNRPIIEHFTINVKETKEGLQHLRREVEEVLLEILNSANAINN